MDDLHEFILQHRRDSAKHTRAKLLKAIALELEGLRDIAERCPEQQLKQINRRLDRITEILDKEV